MEQHSIVIAPNQFKGSLSSPEVSTQLKKGLKEVEIDWKEIIEKPQADGGPGTVRAVVQALDGDIRVSEVRGPLGNSVRAEWGWVQDYDDGPLAVIEMAEASGIELVPDEQINPMQATTHGTGTLLVDAFEAGASEIIVGLGGSATVDGGIGMAEALGFEFHTGEEVLREVSPAQLRQVDRIVDQNIPDKLKKVQIKVASDVTNPLLGPEGAAKVYGPQKGADPATVEVLESALNHWADCVETYSGSSLRNEPGSGAAGGLGFALAGLLDATVVSGAELVADVTDLNSTLEDADAVITGEGKVDSQTMYGKTPIVVAKRARTINIPAIIGVAGKIDSGSENLYEYFDLLLSIARGPISVRESMNQASELVRVTGQTIARIMQLSQKLDVP